MPSNYNTTERNISIGNPTFISIPDSLKTTIKKNKINIISRNQETLRKNHTVDEANARSFEDMENAEFNLMNLFYRYAKECCSKAGKK